MKIKNAYENNLKNISVNIPKNKITSVIGVSGSGKSTLIYSVLANEARRREKIDSGNANCLDYAVRAKFDEIKNLPYVQTLKQRGLLQSISSTIATFTGLHELLRDEFVKSGVILNEYEEVINKPDIKTIETFIGRYFRNEDYELFAIVCYKKYTDGKKEIELLKKNNINKVIFWSCTTKKESLKRVSQIKQLNPNYQTTILVPIELKKIKEFIVLAKESFLLRTKYKEINFYYDYPDIKSGKLYQKKLPELFSFNSISKYGGKCKKCNGKGIIEEIDWDSLINWNPIQEGFLNLEENYKGSYKYIAISKDSLIKTLKKDKHNLDKSFYELDEKVQKELKDIIKPKILKHQGKPSIGKFVKTVKCPVCNGTRLNYKANAVKLYGISISEMLDFTVDELYLFLQDKKLHHKKILTILKSLQKATLGYLTLNRTTDTLSGGELQRLKFALELNNEYKNLLYILDEPSTGLHPYNNNQMIHLIKNLRDKGNTVIVSEHNQDYINNSDYIVELGYGSGENGGKVIFTGKEKKFENINLKRKKLNIDLENSIRLNGVYANNIQNENFTIPLNCLVAISGVSGSGKSSLIHKVLVPTIKQYIADKSYDKALVKNISGIEKVKSVIELTQSQIGINSRSIVATYLNIFDIVREIYASLDISKEFGFDKGYFSFNSNTGACETCNGLGEVENNICPSCLGQRYKTEVLDIKYQNFNISEFLNAPISRLSKLFNNEKLNFSFEILQKIGLSHITLGRTTPTLSGGEAQRLKFAKTLIESFGKIKKGNFLFVLDEPTTGLNTKDTKKIYDIFDEILSYKNSIIIIEHNLDIIKNSDYIIDIGPGSGKNGGKNIFSGNFEELLKNNVSLTSKAFRGDFEKSENIEIDKTNLKEKIYSTKKDVDCNKFYLDDTHFKIEKEFALKYEVVTDDENHKYFKTKDDLFEFANSLENIQIYFNPYVTELYKYKRVPISIKREKIKHLKKLGFKINTKDYDINEWDYRVETDSLEKAYNFGNGWITIKSENESYELFTRLVSIKNKVIGSPRIDERTFNLYINSCIYCQGNAKLDAYNMDLIIADRSKSILDNGFFHSNIKINLKTIINRFKNEGLFDFTKPFNQLSQEEQNIFLFGFKEYKFLKPKGRPNALSDYIRWQGLYRYIYDNLNKIDISDKIRQSKHSVKCPFCQNGFKHEVAYYLINNSNIIEKLR